MKTDRLLYTLLLTILGLIVLGFFAFAANLDQSLPLIAGGWLVAALVVQVMRSRGGH